MFMRKSTHRRIYTKQGEAYRREIEEARSDARKAKAELERFVDSLAPLLATEKTFPDMGVRIWVDVEPRLMVQEPQYELYRLVCERIMRRLLQANHDYRRDLREEKGSWSNVTLRGRG